MSHYDAPFYEDDLMDFDEAALDEAAEAACKKDEQAALEAAPVEDGRLMDEHEADCERTVLPW